MSVLIIAILAALLVAALVELGRTRRKVTGLHHAHVKLIMKFAEERRSGR